MSVARLSRILQTPLGRGAAPHTRQVQRGYLVLADISGYSSYMAGPDLLHAQRIIEQLVRCVLRHVATPWKLVKLEGDAVFFYGPEASFADPQRLVDTVEACYDDFRVTLEGLSRCTRRGCSACGRAAALDLKFLAHFGSFVTHDVADSEDLAGPDVILLHRLLKNSVTKRTGKRAYLLLTDAVRTRLRTPLRALAHRERYPHVGNVACGIVDLRAPSDKRRLGRRIAVSAGDAHWRIERLLPASPAVAWDWCVDVPRAREWLFGHAAVTEKPNDAGRTAEGASFTCDDGSLCSLFRYVDFRPFDYFTTEQTTVGKARLGPTPMIWTYAFEPHASGRTNLAIRIRMSGGSRARRLWTRLMMLLYRRGIAAAVGKLEAILASRGGVAGDAGRADAARA